MFFLIQIGCSAYDTISDPTRNINYGSGSDCDTVISSNPGVWTRFTGSGGVQIPTSPPNSNACGTHATGWYNGVMPSVGSANTGTVCFNWNGDICNWSVQIQVMNCGSFYLYQLVNMGNCQLRYCTV